MTSWKLGLYEVLNNKSLSTLGRFLNSSALLTKSIPCCFTFHFSAKCGHTLKHTAVHFELNHLWVPFYIWHHDCVILSPVWGFSCFLTVKETETQRQSTSALHYDLNSGILPTRVYITEFYELRYHYFSQPTNSLHFICNSPIWHSTEAQYSYKIHYCYEKMRVRKSWINIMHIISHHQNRSPLKE